MSCFCSAASRPGRGQLELPTLAIQAARNSRGVVGGWGTLETAAAGAACCWAGAQDDRATVISRHGMIFFSRSVISLLISDRTVEQTKYLRASAFICGFKITLLFVSTVSSSLLAAVWAFRSR